MEQIKMGNLHELTANELNKLHLIELELLLEMDRICRKCNIKYNIIAGTLLGAVRHKGFIPWDDDTDAAMMRSEYDKFVKACETEMDHEKFYFQDHTITPGYRWGYGKLRMKNTLFLRASQEHMPYPQGVFLDIFPLDNVPDNYIFRAVVNFRSFIIRKFLWSRVGKIADRSSFKRMIYSLMDRLPEDRVIGWYDILIEKSRKWDTRWVKTLLFPAANRTYGYKRKWYENSIELDFENKKLSGLRDYDEYLKFKFGDYMKLPPIEKRKIHPVSKIKLF